MQWPMRWRKCSPRPASSIGRRHAALTSRAGVPGLRGGAPGLLGGEHHLVGLEVVGRRLAAVDRAAEVGGVAVDDAAEVEHDRGSLRDRPPRGGRLRVEVVLAEPGEDVRRERRAARAGEAQLVLDRLGELGHRHAGHDERRRRGHRLLDRGDRAPHRVELLGGLDPAQLVHEPRAGAQAVGAEDPGEVERRLGPDPVADREHARARGGARDALEDGRTRRPSRSRSGPRRRAASRRSNAANIRGSTNTGSAPGRKKAPVTQPCA